VGFTSGYKIPSITELEEDLACTDLKRLIQLKKQTLIRTLEAGTGCFRTKWITNYLERNIVGPGSLTDQMRIRMRKELQKAEEVAVDTYRSHKLPERSSDNDRLILRSKVERYRSCLLDA